MPRLALNKKRIVVAAWLAFLVIVLYLFFFQAEFSRSIFMRLLSLPLLISGSIYLLLGCLRGFTLIPSTYLILLGLVFLPAWPLLILTLVGILFSSLMVYYFSEYLGFDAYLEKKHPASVRKLKTILQKNELPIVVLWSMAPFLPTDAVCYACGTLRVNVYKFLLGVLIGEAVVCYVYIFLGKDILSFFM